jgi:hypothetical protein
MDYESPNSVAITDMRLRTSSCALSSSGFLTTRPYFLSENVESTETRNSMSSMLKNKGASEKILRLLRAQLLVFRRVLIIAILFDVLLILYTKTEKNRLLLNT